MSEFIISGGELYHYGVQGRSGRYKWGSGDRPYQRFEQGKGRKMTFAEKRAEKRSKKAAQKTAKKIAKVTKATSKQLEKKQKTVQKEQQKSAEQKRDYNEQQNDLRRTLNKDKLLAEGTAAEVLKYRSVLSNADLQNALNRIETTKRLESYAEKEVQNGFQKMDDAMKKVKTVNEWATVGISAAKNVQQIMKLLNGEDLNKQGNQQGQKKKN